MSVSQNFGKDKSNTFSRTPLGGSKGEWTITLENNLRSHDKFNKDIPTTQFSLCIVYKYSSLGQMIYELYAKTYSNQFC